MARTSNLRKAGSRTSAAPATTVAPVKVETKPVVKEVKKVEVAPKKVEAKPTEAKVVNEDQFQKMINKPVVDKKTEKTE